MFSLSSNIINDQFIKTQQRMINVIMIKVVATVIQDQRNFFKDQEISNSQELVDSEINDNK